MQQISDDSPIFALICASLGRSPRIQAESTRSLDDPNTRQKVLRLALRERIAPAMLERLPTDVLRRFSHDERVVLAIEHAANQRRNRSIHKAVTRIGLAAKERGFDIVPLKGAVWLFQEPGDFAAWRMMLDADILVDRPFIDHMPGLLESLGFAPRVIANGRFRTRRYRAHFHLPPFIGQESGVVIEVHRHAGFRSELLSNAEILRNRRTVAPGVALSSPWCAAFHSIIHWQIQNDGYRRASCSMREAFEIAQHISRDDVDWETLRDHANKVGVERQCRAALAMTHELLHVEIPTPFQLGKADRHYVARCLALRASPIRARIAQEAARLRSFWDCSRARYRLRGWGAGPIATVATVWSLRFLLAPVFVFIAATGAWRTGALVFKRLVGASSVT